MKLPESVAICVRRLEDAGFATYAVGGCVRDALLGIEPHDYDLCTAASPAQTQAVFAGERLVLAGVKHGTVGVVTDGGVVEITTFRTEGSYTDSRHPDWVEFVDRVEEDLARRDFTVNAMAWSPSRGLTDPFGGRHDLESGILRAVGDPETRFREDALRILRGVRFAVRFGLTVEPKTESAMFRLAPLMDKLARERVFEELCKLLPLVTAADLLHFAPVLTAVIPELAPMVGFDQHSPHHAYDIYTHTAHVVENTPPTLRLRWAALLHDTGKVPTFTRDETGRGHFYGHAQESAAIADTVLRRLKAPTDLREQATELIGLHMTRLEPEKKVIRRWLGRLGPETMEDLLTFQKADMVSKGVSKESEMAQHLHLRRLVAEVQAEASCLTLRDLSVNGNDLMALGYEGRAIGECLSRLLDAVLDDRLPNERESLLETAKTMS